MPSDPLNNLDDTRDSDSDGLTDYQEFILGSNSLNSDFNGDGIEVTGPNNGGFNNDGTLDLNQYFVREMKGTNNEFVGLMTNYVFGNSCGGGAVAQVSTVQTNSTVINKKTNK